MKTFKRVSQGLIFLSLIFGFKLANAQCTPCKETVTEHYFRKVLCDWQGTDGAGQNLNIPGKLWLDIRYKVIICGQCTTIQLTHSTFSALFSSWGYVGDYLNCDPNYQKLDPRIPSPSHPDAQSWWLSTILQMIKEHGAPNANCQTGRIIDYPSGCYEIKEVMYPQGTQIRIEGGDGGQATYTDIGGTPILVMEPCIGAGCCKIRYQPNGDGTYQAVVHEQEPCSGAPNTNPPTISTILDDGTVVTYTGNVISSTGCKSACSANPNFLGKRQVITISTNEKETKVENEMILSAYPTPFNDVIKINTTQKIKKILFYNMNGQVVLEITSPESYTINTSSIRSGMYFMQVWNEKEEVKTIKLIKR